MRHRLAQNNFKLFESLIQDRLALGFDIKNLSE